MWLRILQTGLFERLNNPHWTTEAQKYFKQKGQLELWAGVEGMKALKFDRQQHEHNRKAEEQHARQQVWGYKTDDQDEMGDEFVNFGDIQQLRPVSGTFLTAFCACLVCLCLLLAMAGVGLAIYALSPGNPAPPDMTDQTVELGLGRLGDYNQPEN